MATDHADRKVEWVGLDDVTLAADRGRAPIGPELAGYVVLEAALRVREVGGGVARLDTIAIGTGGHVALTAQPDRGDEAKSAKALRAVLARLLEVSTSSTPALRQCARRRDRTSLVALMRELEGALIPINRAASRRGVARVAKSTLDALEAGALERDETETRDPSPSPVTVEAAPVRKSMPPPLPKPEPEPVVAQVQEDDGATPFTGQTAIEPSGTPPLPLATLVAELEAQTQDDDDGPSEIEVVSNLPPIVEERVIEEPSPSVRMRQSDRVDALIDRFSISNRRDDPALAKELKAMVGIETAVPPAVAPRVEPRPAITVRVGPRRERTIEIAPDVPVHIEEPSPYSAAPVSADTTTVPPPAVARRRRSLMGSMMLLGACIAIVGAAIVRPTAVSALFAPATPPPGDVPAAPPPTARVTSTPTAQIAKMPAVCEASLVLENVPAGSEVVRRLGVTPLSIQVPMHVPIDLVASLEGSITRRVHVDPSAAWQQDPIAPRLELAITLEADPSKSGRWPAKASVVPLRSAAELSASRGLLHATSTPAGATVWAVVEPSNVGALPCGASVELLVIAKEAGPRTVRVEWSAFTGSPPRASLKL